MQIKDNKKIIKWGGGALRAIFLFYPSVPLTSGLIYTKKRKQKRCISDDVPIDILRVGNSQRSIHMT